MPGPREVLVQVVASGVSHMDAYVREGRFQDAIPLEFPARQGCSFAGIVRAVGHGGPRLLAGHGGARPRPGPRRPRDAHRGRPGRAGAATAADGVGGRRARSTSSGLTAFRLVQSLRLGEDDVVLISAAAGGVGHLECQLARLAGARVIGIAGEENHDYLRSIGVKPVGYGDRSGRRDRGRGRRPADHRDARQLRPLRAARGRPRRRRVAASLDRRPAGHRDRAVPRGRRRPHRGRAARRRRAGRGVEHPDARLRLLPVHRLDRALADLDARHSRGVVVVGMDPTAAPRVPRRRRCARATRRPRRSAAAAAARLSGCRCARTPARSTAGRAGTARPSARRRSGRTPSCCRSRARSRSAGRAARSAA